MNNTLEVLTPLRVADLPGRYTLLIAPDGRMVARVPDELVDLIVEALENYDHRKYTEEDMDKERDEAYEDGYEEGYDKGLTYVSELE